MTAVEHEISPEIYKSLFHNMTEACALNEVILDEKGQPRDYRFIEVNDAFCRLTGLSPETVRGMTVRDVLPDVKQHWIDVYTRVALTGEPVYFENFSRSVGRWYQVYAYSPRKGQFVTLFQDITKRKKVEEKLKRAAAEWSTTFDSISDMVSIHDTDFRLVGVNLAFTSALNLEAEEVIGQPCYEVIHGADQPVEDCPHLKTLETGQPCTMQYFEPRLGMHLEVTTSPIFDGDGRMTGSVHVARDVTERKRIEQLKDDFIGLVSHELRTPLTVISGCLSTILSEFERLQPAEMVQLLQDATVETDSLSRLIENLLELSRSRAMNLYLYPEVTDIKQLVRTALDRMRRYAASYRYAASLPEGELNIEADSLRVGRILFNLLDNAVKNSPSGSRVTVSATPEPGRLVISVSDEGKGLSPREQARLFVPFERAGSSRFDRARGAGLGLIVCQKLVEAHGGRIWVKSSRGRGSTFSFSLPMNK
jgi:PAS domain S-box-containing protein